MSAQRNVTDLSSSLPLRMVENAASELVIAPLRLLGPLSEPVRGAVARDVRRSLGMTSPTGPLTMQAGESFLPVNGIAAQVHSDVGPMIIGGISSLFMQMLHPLVMAWVADHSIYKQDPVGRLQRTAQYVAATTYGTVDEAREMFDKVRQVHRRVAGTAPDGRSYNAGEPDLVTWVHVTEIAGFLNAAQRYGTRYLKPEQCDEYWEETAPLAFGLGADWAPRSTDEAEAYFARMMPVLYAGAQAREARDFLVRGPSRRIEERVFYGLIVASAIGLMPGWARTMLGVPKIPLVDSFLVTPSGRTMCAALRWVSQAPWPQAPASDGR